MASLQYRYESVADESFRLFRIEKPCSLTESELIEIHLFEVEFKDSPKFEAVSYAWGEDHSSSAILCNGQHFLVGRNVEAILRRLRQADSVGTFWIDSICINQASISERNIQVPRMRSIYSEAKKVWIWLGEGLDEIEIAISFLSEVTNMLKETASPDDAHSLAIPQISSQHEHFKKSVCLKRGYYDAVDTNFIVDLLNLPWFHRTWPIQELVLASKAVLMYGDLLLSWPNFVASLKELQTNELLQESLLTSRSNPASYYDDTECYRTLTDLIWGFGCKTSVSAVLGLARPKLSTKPEDKVYGLYGIFDHLQIRELPKVDYNRPVHETYTEIAIASIKSEQSLNVLYHVCLPQLIPLPSWVPDWSNTAYFRPILVNESHASRSSIPSYSFNGHQLSVTGITIDSISQIATSTSIAMANFRRGYNARMDVHEIDKRYNGVIELVRTLQEWIKLSRQLRVYPTHISPSEAFFRVVTQNANLGPLAKFTKTLHNTLERWLYIMTIDNTIDLRRLHERIQDMPQYLNTLDDYARLFGCGEDLEVWPTELQIRLALRLFNPEVALVQHEIFLNSYHKTFVITKGGYMGTCPRWAEAGDVVVLISGLKTPFIARKDGRNYRLIGPAYIEGIMEGERWDEEKASDITFI